MEHPETTGAMNYEPFQRINTYRVNRSLNRVLWFSILTGPAIALGIFGGVFKQTMQEQPDIMESMAEIYDYVNLIDFKESIDR